MRERFSSVLVLGLLLSAAGVGVGCNSGNDTVTGRQATFTPEVASPGPASMTMLAGSRSNETFTVRIVATGIDDFFGTTFRVVHDPTFVTFESMSTSSSLLLSGVTANDVTFFEDHATEGRIEVTATRKQNSGGTMTGVDVGAPADVVTLTFKTLAAIAVGADVDNDGLQDGAILFEAPNEVHATGDVNITPLTWSAGIVTAQ